jgi:hypothetical protein
MSTQSQNILLLDASRKRLNAGPKARLDTAHFLSELGFKVVRVPHSRSRHWRKLISQYLKLTSRFNFPAGSTIWCQFPLESTTKIVLQKALRQGLKTVVFIHDIEGLKLASPSWASVQAELDEVRCYSKVLSLNREISAILHNHGIEVAAELECWDYHCEGLADDTQDSNNSFRVVYAGNLSSYKAAFLYKLGAISSVGFDLFGQGLDPGYTLPSNLSFRGAFNPNIPPAWAGNYFGLVWDGESIDTCAGDYGAYLAFNTPHKAALYFSRNVPIIVWRGACIAPLIEEHNAGLLVSSLGELERVLSVLSPAEYQSLKQGAAVLGAKVRSGYFIQTAALKINRADCR